MLNPIQSLLERLAERCIGLAAGLLATTIESLEIAYQAQQHQKLVDLASQYETAGHSDIAATLRERAQGLLIASPAARGEALIRELVPLHVSHSDCEHADLLPGSIAPATDKSSSHRANGRAKRGKSVTPATTPIESATAGNDLYFPLTTEVPAAKQEVTPE